MPDECIEDSDGDGLNDSDELAIGTDPNDRDTDDDGMEDGTEVDMAMGTGCPDPLNADSDGDTLSDGAEVTQGTDPCNADTDGDGLPDNVDPDPLTPVEVCDDLEGMLRDLAAYIRDLDLTLFNGPNENANQGRRNALANRATAAANIVNHCCSSGDPNCSLQGAVHSLESLLDKIDGDTPSPDWIHDSPEKTGLAAEVGLLIWLLEQT